MALTVEIKHPEFEDGVEFDLAGILIPNGGKVELTEDQERTVVAKRQKAVRDVLEGNQFVKVTGTSFLSSKQLSEALGVGVNQGEVQEEVATEESEGSED